MKRRLITSLAALAAWCSFASQANSAPPPVPQEVFPFEEVLHPRTISQDECAAIPDAVWVSTSWVDKGTFFSSTEHADGCIRYYPSANAAGAKTAVLFLHGDVLSGQSTDREQYERTGNVKTQLALAGQTAKAIGWPIIRIARPGTNGSSGMNHQQRRTEIEVRLLDAAITQIKAKLGYARISLAGQSGGGGLVAAILTMGRTDLDCAVIASGVSSVKVRVQDHDDKLYRQYKDLTGNSLNTVYDPVDHIAGVKSDPLRTIYVMGDPSDAQVSFHSQTDFYTRLKARDAQTYLLTASGQGKLHHGLATPAQEVAGWCKSGVAPADMQAKLNAATNVTHATHTNP